jgi:glycogen operon protein
VREPRASINHVTVHDGFSLADLVSYTRKYNEANGEENRDGSDDNHSTNCGVEGPTADPAVLACRRKLRRCLLACLMLSHGVPLILAGDEVGNSQSGNNNPYCQDNDTGWVDWSRQGDPDDDLSELIAWLADLRRRHPQISPRHWVDNHQPGKPYGVRWFTAQATEMSEADWMAPDARFLSYVLGAPDPGGAALYIVLNAGTEAAAFAFPSHPGVARWNPSFSTESTLGGVPCGHAPGSSLNSPSRSILVFEGAR